MRKILLTSAGFNNKKFEKLFLKEIGKPAKEIRAIFVPTAAVYGDAKGIFANLYAGFDQ